MVGQKSGLRGRRFALEFGVPVYQHLGGPQLKTDWVLTAGYQYAFRTVALNISKQYAIK